MTVEKKTASWLRVTKNAAFFERKAYPSFIAATVVIFILILIRNSGLYPTVFADEYEYSLFSRLTSFSRATVPDYLYLLIYGITSFCSQGYLDCARIQNVGFFVASGYFIYLTARRISSRTVAFLIALLALAGPFNSYTAYYMPESMYFF